MRQISRIPFEEMTDEQKATTLACRTNITSEFREGPENFIGEYKFTPHCFEIISRPWQVGLFDLSETEHALLFNWPKQKYFFLEKGTYWIREATSY